MTDATRKRPLKAVSFDLDDTIFACAPVLIRANEKLDEYLHAVEDIHPTRMNPKPSWGEIARRRPSRSHDVTFVRRGILHEQTKGAVPEFEMREAIVNRAMEHFLHHRSDVEDHFFPNALEALDALSAVDGLGLGSITNGNAQVDRIPKLAAHFDITVSAISAGAAKPHALPFQQFFSQAQEKFGVEHPSEILHVGDNFRSDVIGASDFGMRTALIESEPKDRGHVRDSTRPDVVPDVVCAAVDETLVAYVLANMAK